MANNMVQMARSNHVGLLVRSDGGSPTISINNVQKPTGAVMLTKASPFTEAEVQRHSARLGMPLTQKTVKVGYVNKYTLVTRTAFDAMPTIFKVPKELQGTEGIIMMDAKDCSVRIRGVNGEPAVVMEPLKKAARAKKYHRDAIFNPKNTSADDIIIPKFSHRHTSVSMEFHHLTSHHLTSDDLLIYRVYTRKFSNFKEYIERRKSYVDYDLKSLGFTLGSVAKQVQASLKKVEPDKPAGCPF